MMGNFYKYVSLLLVLCIATSCQKTMLIMDSIPIYSSVEEVIQVMEGHQEPTRFTQLPYSGEIATHMGRYKLEYYYDPLIRTSDPKSNRLDSISVTDTNVNVGPYLVRLQSNAIHAILPVNLYKYFQKAAGVASCFFIGTTLFRVFSQGILYADVSHQAQLYDRMTSFNDHKFPNSNLKVAIDFFETTHTTVCSGIGQRCGTQAISTHGDFGVYFDLAVLNLVVDGFDYPMFVYKAYPLKKQWGTFILAPCDISLSIDAKIEIAYSDRTECQTESISLNIDKSDAWHIEGAKLFEKGHLSDIRIVQSNSWVKCDSMMVGEIVL